MHFPFVVWLKVTRKEMSTGKQRKCSQNILYFILSKFLFCTHASISYYQPLPMSYSILASAVSCELQSDSEKAIHGNLAIYARSRTWDSDLGILNCERGEYDCPVYCHEHSFIQVIELLERQFILKFFSKTIETSRQQPP